MPQWKVSWWSYPVLTGSAWTRDSWLQFLENNSVKNILFRFCASWRTCNTLVLMLSHVWLFTTLRIGARQAPLSMGILQARILEWVFISFSRGSSWPRDPTHASYFKRWVLYQWATREACKSPLATIKMTLISQGRLQVKWILLMITHGIKVRTSLVKGKVSIDDSKMAR